MPPGKTQISLGTPSPAQLEKTTILDPRMRIYGGIQCVSNVRIGFATNMASLAYTVLYCMCTVLHTCIISIQSILQLCITKQRERERKKVQKTLLQTKQLSNLLTQNICSNFTRQMSTSKHITTVTCRLVYILKIHITSQYWSLYSLFISFISTKRSR